MHGGRGRGGPATSSASVFLKVAALADAAATAAATLESSSSSSKTRLALVAVKRLTAASEDVYTDTARLQVLKLCHRGDEEREGVQEPRPIKDRRAASRGQRGR